MAGELVVFSAACGLEWLLIFVCLFVVGEGSQHWRFPARTFQKAFLALCVTGVQ